MQVTEKREQRLMTATPEALEMERASIQRFADKLEMDRTIGLLDAGGVQIERELLDWRIDTFNQALDQRSDLKMETIDASSVYTDAAAKAQDRRQAAEESYREQSPGLQSPEEKAAWLEEAREMRERVDREIQRVAQQAPTSAELLAAIDKHLPKQSPEEEAERFEESRATMERIDREIRRDSLVVDLFANQENNIREEWL